MTDKRGSTWLKLYDDLPEHPKVVGLNHRTFRAHIEALCYASRNLTDGFVPSSVLRRLHADKNVARALVDAGLWEENPHGYVIHNYACVQRSAEQVANERRTAAERMRNVRANKRRSSREVRSTETEKEIDKPPNPLNGKTNKPTYAFACDRCAGLTFRTETRLQEHRENVHADYTAEPPPELDEIPF